MIISGQVLQSVSDSQTSHDHVTHGYVIGSLPCDGYLTSSFYN